MFVAKDKSKKNVAAELASKENVYFCPSCGSELILKTGSINTPHFAHKNKDDCDTFTHDMSRWHKEWQDAFPVANREVPLELEIDEEEYFVAKTHWGFDDDSPKNNYGYYHDKILLYESKKDSVGLELLNMKHRADVLACGYVIEFQHSPISKSEFNERNWFYLSCGYKVIWVFDMSDAFKNNQISRYEYNGNQLKYSWKHAKKFLMDFLPQDNENIKIFFQFHSGGNNPSVEHVTWCIEDEDGNSNWKRFCTRNTFPKNREELVQAIKKRWL